ncbi:D-alanyl-D-alanine carboxypeptidase/D-alanyl-D-alanine-endopeptidase (penicillin-binding protein 4) [Actimicrobium sp. GrIS 1.19]|uniref:D-alanyl-D-alanine carboxypeptidase/D-alanyl-D-alanine endopeptidase n=1 Tax=Actimicrobium sp. GrIS 1.19 TaxID=3071708 RepID=UPI002DFC7675|nr:D-alanyl-D-alanine carboxypeptidase/D-alanyl-D-alanine-endopeptidase (penicillin-binding protein 4) [Actimicrobium sp. GrIS 1.19]
MPIPLRLSLALVCLFVAGHVCAMLPAPVSAALKRAGIPPSAVSLQVQDVNSGKSVLALNPEQALNPASTMKLLTTDAALALLGPTFNFTTQAWIRGERSGEQLNGDLILRGGGDPKLVLENFWLFLRKIRAQGVRVIHGNLVLDRSAFDVKEVDPTQFDGDPLKPYNVGPDALLLNYQSLAVRLSPDATQRTVHVSLDPEMNGLAVRPPSWTPTECEGDFRAAISARIDAAGASFDGPFAGACGEQVWQIRPYPLARNRYVELIFRQLWTELGGTFDGNVIDGSVPADAIALTDWKSPSVAELIRDINKFSNNVMARQLFLALGGAQPANLAASRAAIGNWLAANGIDTSGLVLENGAGLSRIERISATTLGQVLVNAFQAPTMPEFISSMPLVGYDGTMRKRLREQGVAGHAHIKSGSLQDVRSIAGYVLAESGKRYAVVFLINHPNAPRAAEAQDALLQWIYEKRQ